MGLSHELDAYTEAAEDIKEAWLGRLSWYSLSGVLVPYADCIQMLANAGILTNLPKAPHDTDVFKRVASKVKRSKITTSDPNIFENYLMREFRDDTTVTRRIVQELVDNKGHKLAFTEMCDIVFDRKDGSIKTKPIGTWQPTATDVVYVMTQEVFAAYSEERGCLNTWAVREWIRAFIVRLGATRVRPSGGVYFIKEEHALQIEALETFGAQLPGECEFHSLPLLDDKKQRLMLQRAFEAETAGEIDDLLTQMSEIVDGDKKISAEKYATFVDQYQELTSKTQDYASLLEEKLGSTGSRLQIFQRSLLQLHAQVKE